MKKMLLTVSSMSVLVLLFTGNLSAQATAGTFPTFATTKTALQTKVLPKFQKDVMELFAVKQFKTTIAYDDFTNDTFSLYEVQKEVIPTIWGLFKSDCTSSDETDKVKCTAFKKIKSLVIKEDDSLAQAGFKYSEKTGEAILILSRQIQDAWESDQPAKRNIEFKFEKFAHDQGSKNKK